MIKSSKIDVEELVQAMDFLSEDFEETKQMIVNLSIHLDNVENLYNKILVEYNSRTNYE